MQQTAKRLETHIERLRNLESRITFRVSVLSKLLDQHANKMLAGGPLDLTAYRLLIVVETFGEISISDIGRFCAMDRAQVSREAVTLEKRGLVTFCANPENKRKKMVRLTELGTQTLGEVRAKFKHRSDEIDELLGPDGKAGLVRGLDLLAEYLES